MAIDRSRFRRAFAGVADPADDRFVIPGNIPFIAPGPWREWISLREMIPIFRQFERNERVGEA